MHITKLAYDCGVESNPLMPYSMFDSKTFRAKIFEHPVTGLNGSHLGDVCDQEVGEDVATVRQLLHITVTQ